MKLFWWLFKFSLLHLMTDFLKAGSMSVLFTLAASVTKPGSGAEQATHKCLLNEINQSDDHSQVHGEDSERLGSGQPLDGANAPYANYVAGFLKPEGWVARAGLRFQICLEGILLSS